MSGNRSYPSSVKREAVASDPLFDSTASKYNSPPPSAPYVSPSIAHISGGSSNSANSSGGNVTKRNPDTSSELSAQYRPALSTDPIEMQTELFSAECKTNPISIHDVPQNFMGLKMLAAAHAWHDVVGLSGKLLFEEESTSYEDLSSITCVRFQGLFRMKMYDDLSLEVNKILAAEEGRRESSNDIDSNGGETNFNLQMAMRLLMNEIKIVTGRSQKALDKLTGIKEWLMNDTKQDSILRYFWSWHVRCHIINAHIRLRNWKVAALQLQQMLNDLHSLSENSSQHVNPISAINEAKIIALCRLSRVLNQIGVMQKSAVCLNKASMILDGTASEDNALIMKLRAEVLHAQGLQAFAMDQCGEAMSCFQNVVELLRSMSESAEGSDQSATSFFNTSSSVHALDALQSMSALSDDDYAIAASTSVQLVLSSYEEGSLLAAAVNNCAICALYEKQIGDAIRHLEQLIKSNPSKFMIDPVVFNLCTLYDLSFAPDVSTVMKKVLQRIAAKFHVDDPILHWRSFRLT